MAQETLTKTPNLPAKLINQGNALVKRSAAIEIIDSKTNQAAADGINLIRALIKQIDQHHDPTIKKIREALESAREAKKSVRFPLEQAETTLKAKRLAYDTQCREDARKKQEEEQAAEDAKAEQQRQDNEDLAKDLRRAGATEQAKILESTEVAPEEVELQEPEKIEGQSQRRNYKATVVNIRLFVEAWLKGEVDKDMVQVNEVLLGQCVRNPEKRPLVEKYPGIEVDFDESLVVK